MILALRRTVAHDGDRQQDDCEICHIGACTVVPQLVVVAIAPFVGRAADSWGRRRLLLLCFAALTVRGALFAVIREPGIVIAVQALDGISAAVPGFLSRWLLPMSWAAADGSTSRLEQSELRSE